MFLYANTLNMFFCVNTGKMFFGALRKVWRSLRRAPKNIFGVFAQRTIQVPARKITFWVLLRISEHPDHDLWCVLRPDIFLLNVERKLENMRSNMLYIAISASVTLTNKVVIKHVFLKMP